MNVLFILFIFFHLSLETLSSSSVELFNNSSTPGPEDSEILDIHGNILCRSCGNEIAFSHDIISRSTPYALYSIKDSLFDIDEVLIQVLKSDFITNIPIITTSASNCVGVQEWEEGGSWYPGYHMKPCVCPDCGEFLGWVFEPIQSGFLEIPSTFFGLILSSLIGESFANSLTVIPGGLSD